MIDKKFKHLHPAMKLTGAAGGVCFHQSLALVLDVPGAELCVGIVKPASEDERSILPNASTEPFLHAWTEMGDAVFAPTTFAANGGLCHFDRTTYYEGNGIRDVTRMKRSDVMKLSGDTNLSAYLRKNAPLKGAKKLVPELLDRMGVAWRVSDEGGVLPA